MDYGGSITAAGTVTAGTNGRVRLGPAAALICDPVSERGLVIGYESFQATDAEGNSSDGEVDLGSPNGRFRNGYFSGTVTANGTQLTRTDGGTLDVGERLEAIESFKSSLKTAITSATDLDSVKTAILDALEELTPNFGGQVTSN